MSKTKKLRKRVEQLAYQVKLLELKQRLEDLQSKQEVQPFGFRKNHDQQSS